MRSGSFLAIGVKGDGCPAVFSGGSWGTEKRGREMKEAREARRKKYIGRHQTPRSKNDAADARGDAQLAVEGVCRRTNGISIANDHCSPAIVGLSY